jgi:hypothetical protein
LNREEGKAKESGGVMDSGQSSYENKLYGLVVLTELLKRLLQIYYSGYFRVPDEVLSKAYLHLCLEIEEILEKESEFRDLEGFFVRPVGGLDQPALLTEYDEIKEPIEMFLATIRDKYMGAGCTGGALRKETSDFVSQIQDYLNDYENR